MNRNEVCCHCIFVMKCARNSCIPCQANQISVQKNTALIQILKHNTLTSNNQLQSQGRNRKKNARHCVFLLQFRCLNPFDRNNIHANTSTQLHSMVSMHFWNQKRPINHVEKNNNSAKCKPIHFKPCRNLLMKHIHTTILKPT